MCIRDRYNRAVVNSKDKISRFKKDGNPEFFDDIYFEYDKLIKRQNKLKNLSKTIEYLYAKTKNPSIVDLRSDAGIALKYDE